MADFLSPSNHHHHQEEDDSSNKHLLLLEQHRQTPSPTATPSSSSVRKPRGRPPGSKNKPKPPVVIADRAHSSMQQVFLQISPSSDVVDAVLDFARRRLVGVSILSASGSVVNVSIRHPAVPGSTIALSGRFEILSLSGFFLPEGGWEGKASAPFGITLAGAQGQVIGGMVAGGLTAAGTVIITAATFVDPEFYQLPITTDEEKAQHHRDQDAKNEMILWGSPAASSALTSVTRVPPPGSNRPPASQRY